jgi:hypothetical protein
MAIINSYPTVTPENADLVILTDTSTTPNSTKTATVGSISTLVNKGFTSYVAKITQSSTNAPIATVLNNDTGLNPTWSRSSTGDYRLSGLLASADTHFIQITGGNSSSASTATTLLVKNVTPSDIQIVNLKLVDGQPADGVTLGFIEVRKYS